MLTHNTSFCLTQPSSVTAKKDQPRKKRQRGFTLIELMVVIAICCTLGSFTFWKYRSYLYKTELLANASAFFNCWYQEVVWHDTEKGGWLDPAEVETGRCKSFGYQYPDEFYGKNDDFLQVTYAMQVRNLAAGYDTLAVTFYRHTNDQILWKCAPYPDTTVKQKYLPLSPQWANCGS